MAIISLGMIATFTCPSPKIMNQETIDIQNSTPEEIISSIKELGKMRSPKELDAFWDRLEKSSRIPYTFENRCLFLYRGEADNVSWNGAFNQWGRQNNVFRNSGRRISGTDIWVLVQEFAEDSRLEYKIVINESSWLDRFFGLERDNTWIHDPSNPNQRKGGFGPDSELRMPKYKSPKEIALNPDVEQGTITENALISSEILGYDISYQLYLPAGFDETKTYPAVFVTDGHEYSNPDMGAMNIVLDNQIANGVIPEIVAVYIDPRNPETQENRRMDELSLNEKYVSFLADELFPRILSEYKISTNPKERVIMGTSLGGLNAAHTLISRPDIFGSAVIHSPAFWYRPAIFDLWKDSEPKDISIFLSSGTVFDTEIEARKMKLLMEEKGYSLHYIEQSESHSWGMWCGLIDDGLAWVLRGERL